MKPFNIDHMFHGLTFVKSAAEITEKAKKKVEKLRAKVEERTKRIADLRKEHGIDDSALVQLLQEARKNQGARQYTYTKSVSNMTFGANAGGEDGNQTEEVIIGAGVINNLLTENDFIQAEKEQASELELIVRNLRPIPRFATDSGVELPPSDFALSKEELKYLGF